MCRSQNFCCPFSVPSRRLCTCPLPPSQRRPCFFLLCFQLKEGARYLLLVSSMTTERKLGKFQNTKLTKKRYFTLLFEILKSNSFSDNVFFLCFFNVYFFNVIRKLYCTFQPLKLIGVQFLPKSRLLFTTEYEYLNF